MQEVFDELVAWATVESRQSDLLAAKAEYFALSGEIFDDDKQFEMRMASFLEFYVCDRVSPERGKTPAQEFSDQVASEGPADRAAICRAFTESRHALYEVRKLKPGMVRLRELFSGEDFDVTERRAMPGLSKGDILEARLLPVGDQLLFSTAFVSHPPGSFDVIRKEVKRRKKHEPNRPHIELVYDCARRSLKADRYRQIAIEKIYDFQNPAA